MKNISKEELNKILKKHEMWLRNEEGGECANLSYVDLRNADLSNTNLRAANLIGVDLSDGNLYNADLSCTDLRNADLTEVDLTDVDLRNADLKYANLRCADLRCANLKFTNLRCADLTSANLEGVDLWNANLIDSKLVGIKTNMNTIGYHLACPEEGSFIGYKRASRYLIKLLIPENAKRSSATTLKCRCSEARVLDIEDIKTGLKVQAVNSNYNPEFIYRVGEIVKVEDFDDNRWNECSTGIHFFMNKDNAINY